MKSCFVRFLLGITIALAMASCSEQANPLATPGDQTINTPTGSSGLAKDGPFLHSVQGGFWFDIYDKKVQNTIAAHQYADGNVDGTYMINAANALGHDKWNKWNGRVLFIQVYDDVPGYEKFAVVGGVETTGPAKGYFEVFWQALATGTGEIVTSDGVYYDLDRNVIAAACVLPPAQLMQLPLLSPSLPAAGGSLRIE